MASPYIKLKNPPIREIILTISFKENIKIEDVDRFKSLPDIASQYTIANKHFDAHVQADLRIKDEITSKTQLSGYMLKHPASNRVIQVKKGSFAFHKVNGYEDFDVLKEAFRHYWLSLLDCTGPLTVDNISARYVNFIDNPDAKEMDDLVTIAASHPFGQNLDRFFSQFGFKYDHNPEIVANVVVASQRQTSLALDILVSVKIMNGRDNNEVFSRFGDLRDAKNDLFYRSITEKTLNKYNQ